MNHPTREEFEDLKEEVRKLREQQTEPIQITVERKYPDRDLLQAVLRKQDEQFKHLKGELESISKRQNEYDKELISHSRNISALQTEMIGARTDILKIRESQADLRDTLKGHTERLDRIESTMATKSDIRWLEAMMMQILNRLPKVEEE
jgi:chromosome segregation ATPase